jgi:hypothetical protein
LAFDGANTAPAAPGDGENGIQWVGSGWVDRGFDPTAPGLTDIEYAKGADGAWTIVEADIYLNADTQRWVASGPSQEGRVDLDSVLTHETGHALGLLHPCEPHGADGAPDCSIDWSFATTTMFPFYKASQSTLSPDDVAGVCFLYPSAACERDAGGPGCSAGSDGRLPVGAPCASADQCLGGHCLAGAAETPICTQACGGPEAECPSSWTCQPVDGVNVCRPSQLTAAGGGGCSVAARLREPSGATAAMVWMGVLVTSVVVRRTRAKRGALGSVASRSSLTMQDTRKS